MVPRGRLNDLLTTALYLNRNFRREKSAVYHLCAPERKAVGMMRANRTSALL
jgi:hypothetical protein